LGYANAGPTIESSDVRVSRRNQGKKPYPGSGELEASDPRAFNRQFQPDPAHFRLREFSGCALAGGSLNRKPVN